MFITHRLSTNKNADKIILMNQGKIVEEGTHEDLMSQGAKYFTLFGNQSQN